MSRFLSTAGGQVADLAATYAESGRLSRGRTLFRKGAVSDLSISEGSLIASVRGSEGDEYETTVGTVLAPPGVIRQVTQSYDPDNLRSIDELMAAGVEICPRDSDLAFGCDCADWDELCKHVVAVLLAFADRVDLDESQLLFWRGIDLSTGQDNEPSQEPPPKTGQHTQAQPPAQAQPQTKPRPAPKPTAVPRSADRVTDAEAVTDADPSEDRVATRSELEALLGDTIVRVPQSGGTSDSDGPAEPPLDPALSTFFGVDLVFDPVDVSGITEPNPLFTEVQLGPLADLGPELAVALRIIVTELSKVSSD